MNIKDIETMVEGLHSTVTLREVNPRPHLSYAAKDWVFEPVAERSYKALGRYVTDFQAKLDMDHEIGARLVSFGNVVTFHIEDIGFHESGILTFQGVNDLGERVQLIQHISQLSVLLVAMKKTGTIARRIGFIWDEDKEAP